MAIPHFTLLHFSLEFIDRDDNEKIIVSIRVVHGVISLPLFDSVNQSHYYIDEGNATGSETISISANWTDINELLSVIQFTPYEDFMYEEMVTVIAEDLIGEVNKTFLIFVEYVNKQPEVLTVSLVNCTENQDCELNEALFVIDDKASSDLVMPKVIFEFDPPEGVSVFFPGFSDNNVHFEVIEDGYISFYGSPDTVKLVIDEFVVTPKRHFSGALMCNVTYSDEEHQYGAKNHTGTIHINVENIETVPFIRLNVPWLIWKETIIENFPSNFISFGDLDDGILSLSMSVVGVNGTFLLDETEGVTISTNFVEINGTDEEIMEVLNLIEFAPSEFSSEYSEGSLECFMDVLILDENGNSNGTLIPMIVLPFNEFCPHIDFLIVSFLLVEGESISLWNVFDILESSPSTTFSLTFSTQFTDPVEFSSTDRQDVIDFVDSLTYTVPDYSDASSSDSLMFTIEDEDCSLSADLPVVITFSVDTPEIQLIDSLDFEENDVGDVVVDVSWGNDYAKKIIRIEVWAGFVVTVGSNHRVCIDQQCSFDFPFFENFGFTIKGEKGFKGIFNFTLTAVASNELTGVFEESQSVLVENEIIPFVDGVVIEASDFSVEEYSDFFFPLRIQKLDETETIESVMISFEYEGFVIADGNLTTNGSWILHDAAMNGFMVTNSYERQINDSSTVRIYIEVNTREIAASQKYNYSRMSTTQVKEIFLTLERVFSPYFLEFPTNLTMREGEVLELEFHWNVTKEDLLVVLLSDLALVKSINQIPVTKNTMDLFDFVGYSSNGKKKLQFELVHPGIFGTFTLSIKHHVEDFVIGSGPVVVNETVITITPVYTQSMVGGLRQFSSFANEFSTLNGLRVENNDVIGGFYLNELVKCSYNLTVWSNYSDIQLFFDNNTVWNFSVVLLDRDEVDSILNGFQFRCLGTRYLSSSLYIEIDDHFCHGDNVNNLLSSAATTAVPLYCVPQNHRPVLSTFGTVNAIENEVLRMNNTGITLSDPDKDENEYEITFECKHCYFIFENISTSSTTTKEKVITFKSVTRADLCYDVLPNFFYKGYENYNLDDVIVVRVDDFGGPTIGNEVFSVEKSISVVIEDRNTPPWIDVGSKSFYMTEFSTKCFDNYQIGDYDIFEDSSSMFNFSITASNGTFSLASTINVEEMVGIGTNSMNYLVSPSLINIAKNYIRYSPNIGSRTDVVRVKVSDMGFSGDGVFVEHTVEETIAEIRIVRLTVGPRWNISEQLVLVVNESLPGSQPISFSAPSVIYDSDDILGVERVKLTVRSNCGELFSSNIGQSLNVSDGVPNSVIVVQGPLEEVNQFIANMVFRPSTFLFGTGFWITFEVEETRSTFVIGLPSWKIVLDYKVDILPVSSGVVDLVWKATEWYRGGGASKGHVGGKIGGKAGNPTDRRREIPEGEEMIRQICQNEYWGVFIDLHHNLKIFGEGYANDYFFVDTSLTEAVTIDISAWETYPEKVVCTRSSVFVLTKNGKLYYIGKSADHEIPGDQGVTSFTKDTTLGEPIRNIYASRHALYVVLDTKVILDQCGVYKMKAIGRNPGGSLGVACPDLENTGGIFMDVDESFIEHLKNTTDGCYPLDENEDGIGDIIAPQVKAMDSGMWVTIKLKWAISSNFSGALHDDAVEYFHFYAGKSHPSTNRDESSLTQVDFSGVGSASALTNSDPIDWVDRLIDGCMYLISQGKIFISGDLDGPGMDPNPYHFAAPFDIEDYGDYRRGEMIYDFICGYACYLTTEDSLYVWGLIESGIGLDALCADNDCKVPTLASNNVSLVVPGLGNYIVDAEQKVVPSYDMIYFEKFDPFRVNRDDFVYQYPPELLAGSGMNNNDLTISIRKPYVFMQLDSSISFSSLRATAADRCKYPDVGVSNWTISHWDTYDYYELVMSWETFRTLCAVTGPVNSTGEYDYYHTRLTFLEYFFRGRLFERDLIVSEEFFIDIEIRFPRQILNTEITIQQDEWSEYWDVYITDKSFDRGTRIGNIKFTSVTRKPNFFVFADVAIVGLPYHHIETNSEYSKILRLSPIRSNNPKYSDKEVQNHYRTENTLYSIFEDGGDSKPEDTTTDGTYSCDDKNCYQDYTLTFAVATDERICNIPRSEFPVNFVSFCDPAQMSASYVTNAVDWSGPSAASNHPDCVLPSQQVTFSIFMEIENLCNGEMFETITTTFDLNPYHDWTYQEIIDTRTHIFQVGEWIYFKAVLRSEKVTIEETSLDRLEWVDDQGVTIRLISDEAGTSKSGESCGLVVDDLQLPHAIGFHFKLINELVKLQPDQKKTYTVKTYLAVRYQGNAMDVKPSLARRMRMQVDASFGQTVIEKGIDIEVLSPIIDRFTVFPYLFGMLSIVAVAVVLGMCVFAVIFSCVFGVWSYVYRKALEIEASERIID